MSLACRLRTLSVGSCRMHVASCSFSAARPSVRGRMSVARSHVCISSRCTVCVASRPSHVADRTFPVASCLLCVACPILHAVCCMLQNARSLLLLVSYPCRSHSGTSSVACRQLQRCRATQRRRIRSASRRRIAIERLSGRQDQLQTEACVRACVRACVLWVGSKRTVCRCGLLCVRRGIRAWGQSNQGETAAACLRS